MKRIEEISSLLSPENFKSGLQIDVKENSLLFVHEIIEEANPEKLACLYKELEKVTRKHSKHKLIKFIKLLSSKVYVKGMYKLHPTEHAKFLCCLSEIKQPKPLSKKRIGKIALIISQTKSSLGVSAVKPEEKELLVLKELEKQGIKKEELDEFESYQQASVH